MASESSQVNPVSYLAKIAADLANKLYVDATGLLQVEQTRTLEERVNEVTGDALPNGQDVPAHLSSQEFVEFKLMAFLAANRQELETEEHVSHAKVVAQKIATHLGQGVKDASAELTQFVDRIGRSVLKTEKLTVEDLKALRDDFLTKNVAVLSAFETEVDALKAAFEVEVAEDIAEDSGVKPKQTSLERAKSFGATVLATLTSKAGAVGIAAVLLAASYHYSPTFAMMADTYTFNATAYASEKIAQGGSAVTTVIPDVSLSTWSNPFASVSVPTFSGALAYFGYNSASEQISAEASSAAWLEQQKAAAENLRLAQEAIKAEELRLVQETSQATHVAQEASTAEGLRLAQETSQATHVAQEASQATHVAQEASTAEGLRLAQEASQATHVAQEASQATHVAQEASIAVEASTAMLVVEASVAGPAAEAVTAVAANAGASSDATAQETVGAPILV